MNSVIVLPQASGKAQPIVFFSLKTWQAVSYELVFRFLAPSKHCLGKAGCLEDLGSKMVNKELHVLSNSTTESTAVLNPKSMCTTLQRKNTPSLGTTASNTSSYGSSLSVKKEGALSFSFRCRKTTLAAGQSQWLEHWSKMEQIAVDSCLCLTGEDTHIFQKRALAVAISHTPLPFVEVVFLNGNLL